MSTTRHRDVGFVLIAIFKIIKGVVLFAVGIGILSLLHKNVNEVINQWARVLQLKMQNRWLQKLVMKLGIVSRRELGLIVGTTFFYSALLLTEGVGLLLQKVWAEYLTIIITASFIPFEMYELIKRATVPRILILTINILIVGYLVVRLQQRAKAKRRQ